MKFVSGSQSTWGRLKRAHIINLLVYSVACPDPVEISAHHRSWAGERLEVNGEERKRVRDDGPHQYIESIPEDDWETD